MKLVDANIIDITGVFIDLVRAREETFQEVLGGLNRMCRTMAGLKSEMEERYTC